LPAYDRLFGMHEVTNDRCVARCEPGPTPLFSTPDDFATNASRIDLDPDFPLPGIAALEFAITRREATADYLTQWQIAYDEMARRPPRDPARKAIGIMLFLTEE